MKQELANKLEVARTSYNAIQKTLTEISKIVQPNNSNQDMMNSNIKSNTDDDWDESSRPKFLNQD